MRRYDAVVLGAGPSGSSVAFFLARAGLRVALVEKSAFPRRKVCGEFVSATTFPVLESMGLGDALAGAAGPPVRRVGLFRGDVTAAAPMPEASTSDGLGRALRRAVLDPTLLGAARAAGADVYQPWKAVAMEAEDGEHVVEIRSEATKETLRAPVVVAAHGSWELGGLRTQPARSDRPDDLLGFKAFYRNARLDPDLMPLVAFPGGYGGMVHADAETVGISLCVRRDALARLRERYGLTAGESFLRYVFETTRGVAEAFADATPVDPPIAAGPLRPGIRPRYDGVFRVGNAAGEAHPVIAEGISMAIQSGFLLSRRLIEAGEALDDPQALERAGAAYALDWASQFAGRIRAARVYSRLCMSPVAGAALGAAVGRFPRLLTAGAVLSGKTKALDVSVSSGTAGPVGA